jgi:T-complex protein 1 subunit gamma
MWWHTNNASSLSILYLSNLQSASLLLRVDDVVSARRARQPGGGGGGGQPQMGAPGGEEMGGEMPEM